MEVSDWVNVHTHSPGAGINIVDLFPGTGVIPGKGIVYHSMGIHPLFIGEDAGIRLDEVRKKAACGEIVAIGEAGLDRNAVTPLQQQMELFKNQAGIAAFYHLPLIIHCVRAYPELISLYRELHPVQGWIVHGFNNREEILNEVIKHGFYVSAGKQMMNEYSNLFRLVPSIPIDRLLIETDDSDFPVEDIYNKVAERRGMELQELKERVFDNFNKLFNFTTLKI